MKKAVFSMIMGIILMSCGGKHHEYPITVDEVNFTDRIGNGYEYQVYPSDNEATQIFSIVPGEYVITADEKSESLQSGSDILLTLKLKLLRPVEVKDDSWIDNSLEVKLLDANDKIPVSQLGTTGPMELFGLKLNGMQFDTYKGGMEQQKKEEKDIRMSFADFLQSAPGTEAEFTFKGFQGMDTYKGLKDVTAIEIVLRGITRDGKLDNYHLKWK